MKIDNLKEVLEYAKLDELPQMNNDVPFKYAIGKVKTTAVEESYCVLNMLNGEPNVKKSFCGGMFVSIIGDIYPYDFTGVEQIIVKENKTPQIEQKEVKIAKSKEVLKPIISDTLKIEIEEKNNEFIEEKAKEEASWIIEGIETFEQAKDWVKSHSTFVVKSQKAFLSKMNDEAKFKVHFREIAKKWLLENK